MARFPDTALTLRGPSSGAGKAVTAVAVAFGPGMWGTPLCSTTRGRSGEYLVSVALPLGMPAIALPDHYGWAMWLEAGCVGGDGTI